MGAVFNRVETIVVAVLLIAMAILPVTELVARGMGRAGVPGVLDYLQHLTLWVGFLGACLASREGQHLHMAALESVGSERFQRASGWATSVLAAWVCWLLAGASIELIIAEAPALSEGLREIVPGWVATRFDMLFEPGSLTKVAGWIPVWVAELVMPVGFVVMAVRFIRRAGPGWRWTLAAWISLPLSMVLPLAFPEGIPGLVWPGIILLIVGAVFGLPIFAVLGGTAWLLFWGDWVTVASIPAETYRIVTNPVFPAIPIFTLAGFVLSESHADRRLVEVFRELFGWLPGGVAIAATLLCAFFTTFTGASGVTILALGGLLLPVLIQGGFGERFSLGLLTATGSLGLLLPPSLVVILYAVQARVPVNEMFVASVVPGLILVVAISGMCLAQGIWKGVPRSPFRARAAASALWVAKWEVLIPVLALVVIFGGFCTLVEAAAVVVVYALFVEMVIYRDIKFPDLLRLVKECVTLIGGVLIILGVAMGLTSYLVDAQIPDAAADWAEAHIHSRWVFLLLLNGALIVVGCLMDIFSALVVVVPIILPMAAVFGVDPVHLGVIFLANLELGYLTPPIGMNLFLSSFRFERPLPTVYRAALPFLGILFLVVLLITFVPWLTLGIPKLFQ